MGKEEYTDLGRGVIKRKAKRRVGIFIDGTGLDRATRRLDRKVDLSRLLAGVSAGLQTDCVRYYTLIPYEDDARQFSFLDAVERAGMEVVVKRLPPKNVKRQVSVDVLMASDIMAFSYGYYEKAQAASQAATQAATGTDGGNIIQLSPTIVDPADTKRIAVVVCPNRELSYAIYLAHTLGVETHLADFGLYGTSDGWKGIDKWIDLSTSVTIWRA
ncbi:NYN domain-containing protein [bacterium]|nr:NYN domain-containing protein [bacterium]